LILLQYFIKNVGKYIILINIIDFRPILLE
jgi:hypothetical protein